MNMHIAVLGTRGIPANYGGFETCAEQLSERWAAWGHDVLVYARKERYEKRPATMNGVSVFATPRASSHFGTRDTVGYLPGYPRSHFPGAQVSLDTPVQHRQCIPASPAEGSWLQGLDLGRRHRMASKEMGLAAEVVLTSWAHTSPPGSPTRWWWTTTRSLTSMLEHFKCATATIAYGAQPIRRSDDAHEILSRFGLKADGYCIFIGRIVPEKGVRELIDAYEQLKTDLPLVIVGDDSHNAHIAIEIWARKSDRVRLSGLPVRARLRPAPGSCANVRFGEHARGDFAIPAVGDVGGRVLPREWHSRESQYCG